jgi:opacity protein-like surface antigen
MKKNILFFIILFYLIPFIKSYAQGSDVLSIYSILSGSSQHVSGKIPDELMQNNYKIECNTQFGAGIGITFRSFVTNSIALGIGIEYMQQGSEISLPIPDGNNEVMIGESKNFNKIHYISLPFNISLYPFRSLLNPYLLIGARINYFTYFDPDYPAYRLTLKPNDLNFSYQIGTGCEINFSKHLILLPQIRYNGDITDAIGSNSVTSNSLRFKNYSFDFLLGVKIR